MGCAVSVSVASDEATTTVPTPAPVETPGAPTPPTGSGSGEFRWSPTCGDYGGTYEYREEDARHDAMVAQWVLEQQALHRQIVPVHTTPAPRSSRW